VIKLTSRAMHFLTTAYLERQAIPPALLTTIRQIGEFKGKQALYRQQAPQILESLLEAAIIESTEASNRIEGVAWRLLNDGQAG
jgi:hypothetical protein